MQRGIPMFAEWPCFKTLAIVERLRHRKTATAVFCLRHLARISRHAPSLGVRQSDLTSYAIAQRHGSRTGPRGASSMSTLQTAMFWKARQCRVPNPYPASKRATGLSRATVRPSLEFLAALCLLDVLNPCQLAPSDDQSGEPRYSNGYSRYYH